MDDVEMDYIEFFEKQIRTYWKNDELSRSTEHELYQPGMYYGSLLGYMLTPDTAQKFMASQSTDGGPGVNEFLTTMYDEAGSWLAYNEESLRVLSSVSNKFVVNSAEETVTLSNDEPVGSSVEEKLLGKTNDKATAKKYVKMLAAIDFRRRYDDIRLLVKSEENAKMAETMFFLFRSIMQFSAYSALLDGALMPFVRLRGSTKMKDRTGYKELIERIIEERGGGPILPTEMWRIIEKMVRSTGRIKLASRYAIDFSKQKGDCGKYPGRIVQIDPEMQVDGMQYDSFKKYCGTLKMGGK